MKAVATKAFQPHVPAVVSPAPSAHADHDAAPVSESAGRPLAALFWAAEHAPGVLRLIRKPVARLALRCSCLMRDGTHANARQILGPASTAGERTAFARRVVENFILFCHDIGRSMRPSATELAGQIEQIDGHPHYAAARAAKRGVIVVTAHMGSFEVGMAALRRQDAKIHVVFRRDVFGRFERMRSALRAKLGVIEAPVDDGWTIWMRLRDALLNDEVVVLQGDRVMPGQKGHRVPVLGADMLLPTGPVKLSLATGAPIVPVFSVRTPGGKIRLCVEPAIRVNESDPAGVDRAMEQLGGVIGKYIAAFGDQWLVLQPAWCGQEIIGIPPSPSGRGLG